ncbi:MAG: c-type cytochrome [Acidobacteria bacterium]|nr:c-type cytochrome [Acidobacteriota bacterium]
MQKIHTILPLLLLVLTACQKAQPPAVAEIDSDFLKNFQVAPAKMESDKNPATEAKVNLGRVLYYEERLSKSQNISCNTCHLLDKYGVDGTPTSTGFKGQKGGRNAPTTYFAAGHIVQFWDGRAADVEEQAKGPVLNPIEMAMTDASSVEATLRSMPEYVEMFKKAFPDAKQPVTFDNAALAIGAFERGLVTESRWDHYLKGHKDSITPEEKAGFVAFSKAGCASCHNGAYVGGRLYTKVGIKKAWPKQDDLGRFAVTKQEHQKMVFKVPSLRNIDKTGPYFHDGSVAQLEEAVKMMSEMQTEKPLTEPEVVAVVAWMKTLTGDIPADYIKKPAMPAATAQTPKPQAD